jgi:SAM-dependent methyltransferase
VTASQPEHDVDDSSLVSTLDTLDDAVNYMRWIVDLARPHLRGPILEVGAGHGTFTGAFAEIAPVHAVEPGTHGSAFLRERFADDTRVTVTAGMISDVPEGPAYGSAVMINVLEHIDDDVGALRDIRSRLLPDGRIAIWVPAFQLLFSDFDRKLGHHRRYRKAGLRSVVESAGFDVVDARYVNAPGFFSWLLITRLLKQEPTAGPLVTIFDRVVVPVVRRLESIVAPPFGQSILLIAANRARPG